MIFRVIVVVSEMAHPIDLRHKKHQDYRVVHLCSEGFLWVMSHSLCALTYRNNRLGTAMPRFSVLPFSGLLRFCAQIARDRDLLNTRHFNLEHYQLRFSFV